MSTFLLFGIVLVNQIALAGGGHVIGNGGGVVACMVQAGIMEFQTYDLIEGRLLFDLTPKYSSLGGSYKEQARDIIDRLKDKNPSRTQLYQRWLSNFEDEMVFLREGESLLPMPDIAFGFLPPNCLYKQVLLQSDQLIKGKRYLVDPQIWRTLGEEQKAALAIHEFIYREALLPQNRHINSVLVRRMNQYLHADKFRQMTLKAYHEFLFQHEFSQADAHGISIQLFEYFQSSGNVAKRFNRSIEYYSDNEVSKATVYPEGRLQLDDQDFSYECPIDVHTRSNVNSSVDFFSGGKVKSIRIPAMANTLNSKCGPLVYKLLGTGGTGFAAFNQVKFDERKRVSELILWESGAQTVLELLDGNFKLTLAPNYLVSSQPFYSLVLTDDRLSLWASTLLCRMQIEGSARLILDSTLLKPIKKIEIGPQEKWLENCN